MFESKNKCDLTFVEYRGYRIFYDYKPQQSRAWSITIERFSTPKPDSPNLSTYWFDDMDEGIQYVKDVIDARLKYFSNSDLCKKELA
jgi:hypothetical protein